MASYVDLLKTNYPNSIDERTTNPYFRTNVNYEDRTSTTDPKDYYVLAEDINAIQEALIAVERTLGIMPQGNDISTSIADRISDIETFTVKAISLADGFADLDQRFMWGGLKPIGLAANAKLSIKYHLHDGTQSGADKIDVNNHVTGLLKKSNIDLTSNTLNMLTAADIKMSTSSSQTITDRFGEKYNTTGGQIDGSVIVKGTMNSRTFAEFDAYTTTKVTGTDMADVYAESGNSRKGRTVDVSGSLMKKAVDLRYGNYVACFRTKVSSIASSSAICKFYVKVGNTEIPFLVKPSDFKTANTYEMIYLEFANENLDGSSARPAVEIGAHFYSGIAELSIDSVVVTPIHTAVYDNTIAL